MKKFSGIQILIVTMTIMSSHLFAAAETQSDDAYKKRCQGYGCTFVRCNDSRFIQAKRLPQHDWENPAVPERRHIDFMQNDFIPFCNATNDLREISSFIQSHRARFPAIRSNSAGSIVTVLDQDHARIVLDESSRIFRDSKRFGCPIVVEEVQLDIDESSNHLGLRKPDNNHVESIISRLAAIRRYKDADFHCALTHIALIRIGGSEGLSYVCFKNTAFRDACIKLFDQGYVRSSSLPPVASPACTDKEDCRSVDARRDEDGHSIVAKNEHRIQPRVFNGSRRLPFGFGLFAGLGLSGSVWFAAYLLRSCQNRIRVASGCASAAAGMAFLFARHKLAQEFGNTEFWQGLRYSAGVSALASAGLFAVHDSSAVQKLLAAASRTK